MKKFIKKIVYLLGFKMERINREFPFRNLLDPVGVEILGERAFQDSCQEISGLTLLDTSRLANLWLLCRLSNPSGNILEIGSYKGGAALHLSNSSPQRKIVVCDSFVGFDTIDPVLDNNFNRTMFKNTVKKDVEMLFVAHNRSFEVIDGFFPESCQNREIGPISFVHLDADTYKSTRESLFYLRNLMITRSLIVLDDYLRKADGVIKAVTEFTAEYNDWHCFPLFPGQGLLVHRSWFDGREHS